MQVSVEELDGLERRMTVQVPAERIEQEVQSRLTSLSRSVKLHGFRPGKVPFKVVKRMYGPQVRQEVMNELLKSSFQDALLQEKLRPVSGPKIEPKPIEEGGNLEYSATFEVLPEFELAGIDGLRVEHPKAEVTEADIDTMLENLRKQRIVWHDVERVSQQGDRVTISFEGKLDGEDFPDNKGENVPVVIGEGNLIKDLEEALIGLKAGDKTEFDVTFPPAYHVKDLAGKTVHFKVNVDAVAEGSLPEVDEEFAASFGIKEGGVEALRQGLRKNMEHELQERIKVMVKQQVMQGLLDANTIPLPQAMVDAEIEHLSNQANYLAGAEAKSPIADEARRRVALGLIVAQVMAANNIKLDNTRLYGRLEALASAYQDPAEVIQWYQQNPHALEAVRTLALEDQVVDWLLARAQVVDKPSSFDEVMKPNGQKALLSKE